MPRGVDAPVRDVVSLDSLRFGDLGDGRTRLVGPGFLRSVEDRDATAASGTESGTAQGDARLEALLRAGT